MLYLHVKTWAANSAVEYFPHTEGAIGSNPVPPIFFIIKQSLRVRTLGVSKGVHPLCLGEQRTK